MTRVNRFLIAVTAISLSAMLGGDAYARKTQSITRCDNPGTGFVNITRSGTYLLENDVVAIGPDCIDITGFDRVNIHLNGYEISDASHAAVNIENSNRVSIIGPGTLNENHFGINVFGLSNRLTIRGIFILNGSSVGIHITSLRGAYLDVLIENNIVFNNSHHGIFIDFDVNDVQIIDNEVIDNIGSGILLNPGRNRVVRGNNVVLSGIHNIFVNSSNIDVEVVNNIALGATTLDIFAGGGSTGVIANNICETSDTGSIPVDCPPERLPDFDIDHF